MSWKKKVLLILLAVFIIIQFIQPARNKNGQVLATDITRIYTVPNEVMEILKKSCYDCHSNNTHYPWYAYIQPSAWWLASHIKDGKEDLNFSDFGSYSKRKQQNKFKAIASSVDKGEMPLPAYTVIHGYAKLSKDQKALISGWAKNLRDSLQKQ